MSDRIERDFDHMTDELAAEHDAALAKPRSPRWARVVTAVGVVIVAAAATVIAIDPMGAI